VTESLLNFPASRAYKVCKENAQLCLPQVTCLGMVLKGQTCSLSHKWINLILHYSLPQTIKQLRAFLGVTGFCRIWILRYAALTRPLHQLLKDAQQGSQSLLNGTLRTQKLFRPSNWHPNSPRNELAHQRPLPAICL
jgi:hypothetical protein